MVADNISEGRGIILGRHEDRLNATDEHGCSFGRVVGERMNNLSENMLAICKRLEKQDEKFEKIDFKEFVMMIVIIILAFFSGIIAMSDIAGWIGRIFIK